MKRLVDIYVKSDLELKEVLAYLEERGVRWESGDKPTQWGTTGIRYLHISTRNTLRCNDAKQPDSIRGWHLLQSSGYRPPLVSTPEYMVVNPTGPHPPKIKHTSYKEAAKVATKMAHSYPGHEFFVVKVLPGSVKTQIKRETTNTLENPDA